MAKTKKEIPDILKALNFVSLAQRDKGAPYQTHTRLYNQTAIAYDGVLAAGQVIDENIVACPHSGKMKAALSKCKGPLSVTQLDSGRISVKSGKFRALIPCSEDASLVNMQPDPPIAPLDNRLKDALLVVSPIILEGSQRVVTASACIRSGSVLATTGHIIVEYWHGLDMPPNLLVPKLFINALAKIDKDIVAFGYSETSLTLHFDDNSWLKTQLYNEKWPDCDSILNKPFNSKEIPPNLKEAVDVVADFVDDGRVRFKAGLVCTHDEDNIGASYEVEGLTDEVLFNIKQIQFALTLGKAFDFGGIDGITYFQGDNVRGVVSQIKDK